MLESLELMILKGFYHVNCGDARRISITSRRAIITWSAQLPGLHRLGHYRFKTLGHHAQIEPETMWTIVVRMER